MGRLGARARARMHGGPGRPMRCAACPWARSGVVQLTQGLGRCWVQHGAAAAHARVVCLHARCWLNARHQGMPVCSYAASAGMRALSSLVACCLCAGAPGSLLRTPLGTGSTLLARTHEHAAHGEPPAPAPSLPLPLLRRPPPPPRRLAATKSILICLFLTCFSIFDVPVFWPVLLLYFCILFFVTMKRQIKHMIKYRYLPFSWGKKVRAEGCGCRVCGMVCARVHALEHAPSAASAAVPSPAQTYGGGGKAGQRGGADRAN